MKIGILGGTFNPIHNGHIHLAKAFLEKLGLDEVCFIPTNHPPHKQAEDLASGEHRLNLCRLAVAGEDKFTASGIELLRPAPSYTADTLRHLREEYPTHRYYLLLGSDMFLTVEQWWEARQVLAGAVICGAARNPGEYQQLLAHGKMLEETYGAQTAVVDLVPLPISSTQVRESFYTTGSGAERIPPAVEDYIRQNGLYGLDASDYPWPLEEYQQLVLQQEPPQRMHHSHCVAEQAVHLAKRYGAPEKLAYIAGLLHDICKNWPLEQQLQRILKSVIIWDNLILQLPPLWHGFSAYGYLRDELNLQNIDILNAVYYHTTGRAGMSLLEKIIYIADLTSSDRTYGDAERMRLIADVSLDDAIREALEYTRDKLLRDGTPASRDTIAVCAEYGVPLD